MVLKIRIVGIGWALPLHRMRVWNCALSRLASDKELSPTFVGRSLRGFQIVEGLAVHLE